MNYNEKNFREYKFMAMRRSGHHSIMFWIMKQLKGSITYRNHINCRDDWLQNIKSFSLIPLNCAHYKQLLKLKIQFVDNGINYVYNLEDEFNSGFSFEHGKLYNIFILRNVFNHFAAYLYYQSGKNGYKHADRFFKVYKEMYNKAKYHKIDIILYDEWLNKKDYRKKISNRLDLDFNDSGFQIPATRSSFVKDLSIMQEDIKNKKMLHRWKLLEEDKEYIKILSFHKDCIDITLENFTIDNELMLFIQNNFN